MSSLSEPNDSSENQELGLFEDPKFVQHNMRQITRVYPYWLRQDSSNMKVSKAWNAGCQFGFIFFNYKILV